MDALGRGNRQQVRGAAFEVTALVWPLYTRPHGPSVYGIRINMRPPTRSFHDVMARLRLYKTNLIPNPSFHDRCYLSSVPSSCSPVILLLLVGFQWHSTQWLLPRSPLTWMLNPMARPHSHPLDPPAELVLSDHSFLPKHFVSSLLEPSPSSLFICGLPQFLDDIGVPQGATSPSPSSGEDSMR